MTHDHRGQGDAPMTWAALFDRATAYDVSLEEITETLATRRDREDDP